MPADPAQRRTWTIPGSGAGTYYISDLSKEHGRAHLSSEVKLLTWSLGQTCFGNHTTGFYISCCISYMLNVTDRVHDAQK